MLSALAALSRSGARPPAGEPQEPRRVLPSLVGPGAARLPVLPGGDTGQTVDEGIEADGRLSTTVEARGPGSDPCSRGPRAQGLELVDEGVADAGGVLDAVGRRKVVAPGTELAGGSRPPYGPWGRGRQARIDYRLEQAAILSRPDYYD